MAKDITGQITFNLNDPLRGLRWSLFICAAALAAGTNHMVDSKGDDYAVSEWFAPENTPIAENEGGRLFVMIDRGAIFVACFYMLAKLIDLTQRAVSWNSERRMAAQGDERLPLQQASGAAVTLTFERDDSLAAYVNNIPMNLTFLAVELAIVAAIVLMPMILPLTQQKLMIDADTDDEAASEGAAWGLREEAAVTAGQFFASIGLNILAHLNIVPSNNGTKGRCLDKADRTASGIFVDRRCHLKIERDDKLQAIVVNRKPDNRTL